MNKLEGNETELSAFAELQRAYSDFCTSVYIQNTSGRSYRTKESLLMEAEQTRLRARGFYEPLREKIDDFVAKTSSDFRRQEDVMKQMTFIQRCVSDLGLA